MDSTSPYTGPAIYNAAIVVAILSGLAVILDIPPLIWHARNNNLAAASLVFWVILLNSMYFMNALIWRNDDIDSWYNGQGLCDIQVKLQVGSWVAVSGALACIMRNLARVMDTENSILVATKAQRLHRKAFDVFFCFGFPLVIMALSYIPQHYRYYLLGISGCAPSFDTTWPTIVLVYVWPAILSLADAYYAVLLIVRISRYRRTFSQILSAAGTTKSRFMRLFVMSMILVVVFTPTQFYALYFNVRPIQRSPYSWTAAHADIALHPRLLSGGSVLYDRWIGGAAGALVFVFFGLGEDAMRMYTRWLARLLPAVGERGARSKGLFAARATSVGDRAKLLFSSTSAGSTTLHRDVEADAGTHHKSTRNYDDRSILSSSSEKSIDLNEMLASPSSSSATRAGEVLVRKEIWQTTHAKVVD